ncbi:hypothetical protein DFH29DRAFT_803251, partial [Suillus ampliporus]
MTNSIPPAGRSAPTHDQIIAENTAITTHNQAHQLRRNQGDTNVENDESLHVIPPTFNNVSTNRTPTINNPSAGPSSVNNPTNPTLLNPPATTPPVPKPITPTPSLPNASYASMIAAFQKLSPNKQASFQSSINAALIAPSLPNTSSSSNNAATSSSLIFDISSERTIQNHSINDSYGVHMYILELARNHQHIPFSLLTTKVSKRLFLESSTLKFVTFYSSHRGIAPMKCHLIDISQFPTESSISIPEWHEAWVRYLRFLTDHASPEIHGRWANHYQTLREHPDFADNWTAILAFNIEQRAS